MNKDKSIEIAERELKAVGIKECDCDTENCTHSNMLTERAIGNTEMRAKAIPILAGYIMENAQLRKEHISWLATIKENAELKKQNIAFQEQYNSSGKQFKELQGKLEFRKGLYEDASKKAVELQQKLDRMEKELVEEKYLNDRLITQNNDLISLKSRVLGLDFHNEIRKDYACMTAINVNKIVKQKIQQVVNQKEVQ